MRVKSMFWVRLCGVGSRSLGARFRLLLHFEVCDLTTLTVVTHVAAVAVPNGPYRWRAPLTFGAGPHQVRFYGKASSDTMPRPYAVATF